jgi:NADPH2:quinone reductase
MKAIRLNKTGEPSVLEIQDIEKPTPKAGEALIQLKAAGLNFIDIYIRKGIYQFGLPLTPGMEGAGVVEAVGEGVSEVKVGDRVAYAGHRGSYAEYTVVKASHLIPLPKKVSFEEGAAFPLQGMTAHYLLHECYRIKPGDNILVHAAAGGVGLLVVQWVKHKGGRVIGTVSTEEKAKIARQAGADEVILYTQQDFVEETKRLTGGNGADYIIDGVGKSTFTKDLDAVRKRGYICIFGSSSGPAEPLSPNLLMTKSVTIWGGSLFNYMGTRKELLGRARSVLKGMNEGWLKLRIDKIFPLEQAAEAHRLLEGRQTTGKVILKISD